MTPPTGDRQARETACRVAVGLGLAVCRRVRAATLDIRPPRAHWQPPAQVDEVRIVELLGRGGMGEVYLGHDTALDRAVAIKFIAGRPDHASRQRFLVEARAAARLQHPNVVAIYRVGEVDGHPYLISELVRGTSLDRLARPVPSARLLAIGIDLARGLAAAHRRAVLHRDLKPHNAILADDGTAKLLDFGLAKLLDDAAAAITPASSGPRVTRHDANIADTLPAASDDVRAAGEAVISDEITLPGTVVGTPYYMAPEQLLGQGASARSDVYSLGALLCDLAANRPPNRHVPFGELSTTVPVIDAPPMITLAPDLDPRLAALIDRCLRRDPQERFASGDEVREALEQLAETSRSRRRRVPEGNPYRGLAPFEAAHRGVFCGRASDLGAVIDRLRGERFVLVAGESGVGKSSLVRAAVAPEIEDGILGDHRTWTTVTVMPGARPILALAAALGAAVGLDAASLAELAAEDAHAAAARVRGAQSRGRGILIVVDQLEELVTIAAPDEAAASARWIAALAAGAAGCCVIATARADFLGRLAELPVLGGELARSLYLLRPLDGAGLRDAIVGPAHATGVRFETDALVERLIREAGGSLPLLQFALAELWDARDVEARCIVAGALDAMGGVGVALGCHADAVIATLAPPVRAAARRIFHQLVSPQRTRARANADELGHDAATELALEQLIRGRLIIARAGEPPTYELVHEALISGWRTLSDWLDDAAGVRAIAARIHRAAADWHRLGRAEDGLLGARQLAEASAVPVELLAPDDLQFVAASRRAQRRRRLARLATAVGVPLAIGVVIVAIALARHSADRAASRRAAAELDQRIAARTADARSALDRSRALDLQRLDTERDAFAKFDGGDRDGGELAWSAARAIVAERDRHYADATAAAETALLLDAARVSSRELLADVLADRVRTSRGTAAEAELVARLAVHDAGGVRRARLATPATLRIDGVRDAAVEVSRPGLAPDHARAGAPIVLAPGAYRVVVRTPQRPEVTTHVLLEPGEARTERLVPPDLVPDGFVFVPAGRALLGSRADDDRRREFLSNAPLHPVEVGAFLIARHETTWADWIAFLEDVPASERELRRPRAGGSGMSGSVELRGEPGRWTLRLHIGATAVTARWGEPVRYPGRPERAQDWRRIPVTGIRAEDAAAYAAWLGRTGRVPGARLCSDREWERAARGADGRTYPHGETLTPDDANFDATYGGDPSAFGPDEVGSRPASRSPFGIDDLAGNVFELVRGPGGEVIARGGSFAFDPNPARSDFRDHIDLALRDVGLGVRICATPQ